MLNRGIVINGHLNISYSQGPEGRLWPDNRFLFGRGRGNEVRFMSLQNFAKPMVAS